jgi:hypothetical protein
MKSNKYEQKPWYLSHGPGTIQSYLYAAYGPCSPCDNSKLRVIPTILNYICEPAPKQYSLARMTEAFTDRSESRPSPSHSIDDLLGQKAELGKDRIDLILDGVYALEQTRELNLQSLYQDLLRVSNMHLERMHDYWKRDSTWLDIEKQYLGIRDQIRREQANFDRSVSLLGKELRGALLDWKKHKQKEALFNTENETGYHH